MAVAQASTTPSADADAAAATLALNLTQTLADQVAVQEPLQEVVDSLLGPIADGDPTGELVTRLQET